MYLSHVLCFLVVLRVERATDNTRSNLTTLEKIMYTLLQKKLIIFPIKFLVPTHARRSHISVLDTRVVKSTKGFKNRHHRDDTALAHTLSSAHKIARSTSIGPRNYEVRYAVRAYDMYAWSFLTYPLVVCPTQISLSHSATPGKHAWMGASHPL